MLGRAVIVIVLLVVMAWLIGGVLKDRKRRR
jgi:hypothetical protein